MTKRAAALTGMLGLIGAAATFSTAWLAILLGVVVILLLLLWRVAERIAPM